MISQLLSKTANSGEPTPEAIAELATFIDQADFGNGEKVQIKFSQFVIRGLLKEIHMHHKMVSEVMHRVEYIDNQLHGLL